MRSFNLLDDECLRVVQVRNSSITRTVHELQLQNHVLHVAFNNRLIASDKRFEGRPLRVEPGRLVARTLYLPAGGDLRGWSVGQVDYLRLEISPAAVQVASEEAGQRICTALRPARPLDDPVLWHLACLLCADLQAGCPGGLLLRDNLQNLLAHHIAIAPLESVFRQGMRPGALPPARLRAVREYIDANLHREIRLTELAAVARLSLFHFARAFKSVVGKSPYQYVIEQRLLTSCRLLESTVLSVTEIAAAVGFATASGFAASFRRRWGVSPGSYRRSTGVAS